MARLPVPGSDDGTWGNILNEFLLVEHNADGTHEAFHDLGDVGATATIDLANGRHQRLRLTADCTLSASGFVSGVSCSVLLEVVQDGTGGHALVLPSGWSLPLDGSPAINPDADSLTLVSAVSRNGGTTGYVVIIGTWA